MQQHGSKYIAHIPTPSDLGMESTGGNSTFSEHGHVAYQVNWNHECINIVANNFTTPALGMGQNSTFSEYGLVAYPIQVPVDGFRSLNERQYLRSF